MHIIIIIIIIGIICYYYYYYYYYYFINKLTTEKAGNEVINILVREEMENTPLKSRMWFPWNLTSGAFLDKTHMTI